MKFDDVRGLVRGVPYITEERGRQLFDFVLEKKPRECLELGFAHGVSVCYMAAALDEIGTGHVTAIDLWRGQEWQQPSIEELLARTGLTTYVTVLREQLSYTWFLRKKIEERTTDYRCEPIYDFCYIDGAKNWTIDGAGFFMVDKLLRENGFILFDDMSWRYSDAAEWSAKKLEECGILVSEMDEQERTEPHIRAVFRLLVMQHPSYSNFVIEDEEWGWAQKIRGQEARLTVRETAGLGTLLKRNARRVIARVRTP